MSVPQAEYADEETPAALARPKSDEEYRELLDRRRWCESRLRLGSP